MAVTFKDVARLAGVSTQTVSRVTNGADNVAEETRKRVNDAIKKLDYVPNKGAQMLRRANSHILGIISLDICLYGAALIANGIRHQAHELGDTTALCVLEDCSLEGVLVCIRKLLAQKIESIVVNVPISKAVAESLVEQFSQLTFVFIDGAFFSPPLTTIKQDFDELGRRAAALAVNALQDLKQTTVNNKLPVELVIRQTSQIKNNEFSNKQAILSHLNSIRALVAHDGLVSD